MIFMIFQGRGEIPWDLPSKKKDPKYIKQSGFCRGQSSPSSTRADIAEGKAPLRPPSKYSQYSREEGRSHQALIWKRRKTHKMKHCRFCRGQSSCLPLHRQNLQKIKRRRLPLGAGRMEQAVQKAVCSSSYRAVTELIVVNTFDFKVVILKSLLGPRSQYH